MTQSTTEATVHRFAGWELRPQERLLLVRGEPVKVGSRAFDVLRVLAERAGQVVSKGEMLDLAWPGLVVEENNLSVQITALRKLLGGGAIVNVSGIGYRLAALPESGTVKPTQTAQSVFRPPVDFVGRDSDIAALLTLVGVAPVVSIVGTGGVGKTTLARVVLSRCSAARRDGLHWIDLAPLRDGAMLLPLVAKSLGIELDGAAHAREDLVSAIARSDALVTLDNCEHLLADVASFVDEVMQGTSSLRWLATSQAPLRVAGERVYRLEPLHIPPDGSSMDDAMAYGAVALLCQRACAADRHFVLQAPQLATAIDLCRQLDGLPLAIEMAAAHVATLGLTAVHEQLGQRLHLQTGLRRGAARHHSLRSAFDWSHSLLSADEQRVFRRLAPFPGSFGMTMAQALVREPVDSQCATDANPLAQAMQTLSMLVEKSLVQRDPGNPGRCSLLASAREYAASQLAAAGETDHLHRRHAEVVADWFDSIGAHRDTLRDDQWQAATAAERDNVRAALTWACRAGEPDLLARLISAMAQIDALSHRVAELVQWELPLDMLMKANPARRAPACMELSWAHYADGSRETGTELALRALNDYQALHDTAGIYLSLARLVRLYESRPGLRAEAEAAWAALQSMDSAAVPLRTRLAATIAGGFFYGHGDTIGQLQDLADLARRAGFDTLADMCRARLSDRLLVQRRFDQVATPTDKVSGEAPSRTRALMLINRAIALIQLGRTDEAREPGLAALRVLPGATYVIVDAFAFAAARARRWTDAALMAGYGQRVRRERDERPDPAEAELIDETLALLRVNLPGDRLAELMRLGAALSTAEALALVAPEGESSGCASG